MNNINTGQLMEYNEDNVRLLCYQNEVSSSVFQSVPNLIIVYTEANSTPLRRYLMTPP